MAATALLKFTQGSRIGGSGHALIVNTGTAVTIENSDNTDVASWRIELLYGPPGSSFERVPDSPLVLAQNSNNTPIAVSTPEIGYPGSYRIRLTVWEGAGFTGTRDVDIRNYTVLSTLKAVIPPFQRLPDVIPITDKPDELNFEGQPWGWAGPNYDHPVYGASFERFRLMNAILKMLDIERAIVETASNTHTVTEADWAGADIEKTPLYIIYTGASGGFTLTLRASPVRGETVFLVRTSSANSQAISVNPNGRPLQTTTLGSNTTSTHQLASNPTPTALYGWQALGETASLTWRSIVGLGEGAIDVGSLLLPTQSVLARLGSGLALGVSINQGEVLLRPTGGNVSSGKVNDAVSLFRNATSTKEIKVAPENYYAVATIANSANVNIDHPLTVNGLYRFAVEAKVKRATTGDYRTAAAVVCVDRISGTPTIQGSVIEVPGGNATGLTLTITINSGNLRVNIANATGESISGRLHIGAEYEEVLP